MSTFFSPWPPTAPPTACSGHLPIPSVPSLLTHSSPLGLMSTPSFCSTLGSPAAPFQTRVTSRAVYTRCLHWPLHQLLHLSPHDPHPAAWPELAAIPLIRPRWTLGSADPSGPTCSPVEMSSARPLSGSVAPRLSLPISRTCFCPRSPASTCPALALIHVVPSPTWQQRVLLWPPLQPHSPLLGQSLPLPSRSSSLTCGVTSDCSLPAPSKPALSVTSTNPQSGTQDPMWGPQVSALGHLRFISLWSVAQLRGTFLG